MLLLSMVKLRGKRIKRRWFNKEESLYIDTEEDCMGNECIKRIWSKR